MKPTLFRMHRNTHVAQKLCDGLQYATTALMANLMRVMAPIFADTESEDDETLQEGETNHSNHHKGKTVYED